MRSQESLNQIPVEIKANMYFNEKKNNKKTKKAIGLIKEV